MSDATPPQVVPAATNTPSTGSTTHYVNLVISANPTSGSGFPVTKTFKLNLITDSPATSPTNEVVGCMPITQGSRRWLSFSVGGGSPARQANTTYINNTSQEIQVAVSTYSGAAFSRCSVGIRIQNTDDLDWNFVNNSIGAARCSAQAIIPAGASYEARTTMTPVAAPGENLLQSWHEFR